MLPASQQHYPKTVMISSTIPSSPTHSIGMVPVTTFFMLLSKQDLPGCVCQHMLVYMCWNVWLFQGLPETPQPVCYHPAPLTAVKVSLWVHASICLHSWFCTARIGSTSQTQQLCSPTKSQRVMKAWPFDVRTSRSYRWTLHCFLLLSVNILDRHQKLDPKVKLL